MMRTAISPRLATRTRRIEVIGIRETGKRKRDAQLRHPFPVSRFAILVSRSTSCLFTELERLEGLTQPARIVHGSPVQLHNRPGPRFVLIDGETQRRKHEVLG